MTQLLLIGCGNMGHAMLAGWMRLDNAPEVTVIEPTATLRTRAAGTGATTFAAAQDLAPDYAPDVVVFAVKPQIISTVLADYARFRSACFVSVAAGTTLATLEAGLGAEAALVRVMPNTPAAISRGVFGLFANARTTAAQVDTVTTLLSAGGTVLAVDSEDQIDMITAVSGSGPAYVFHMIEALSEAAKRVGLPEDIAVEAARQTVFGAAALTESAPEDAAQLRVNVTSPNGTTAAALDVLMGEDRLTDLMTRAVEAAFIRAQELAKGN